ncbi:MAG: hypothetical protein OEU26_14495 [Candidatus Tectomicrobia bacterium]|nr:hypothetical protein [Candidatus Tectomicrobia bacterium]
MAQYASVIGRQFSYDLLQAVSELDETTLQRELSRLVKAELVYQRGLPPQATYLFKHALVTDVAYQSLLKSTRQQYHQRMAIVLASQFPDRTKSQPELLAHHYTEAGRHAEAIAYGRQAGEQAAQRSANAEAIAHLTKGLELLTTLPDTSERTQQELTLLTALGPAVIVTKGPASSEAKRTYTRAWEVCQQVEPTSRTFSVLHGLATVYLLAGELRTAHELAAQGLHLAQQLQGPSLLTVAHWTQGMVLMYLGEFTAALRQLEQSIALYKAQPRIPVSAQNPGVGGLSWTAGTLWYLGYPDQALTRSHEARTLAQDLAQPYSLAWVQFIAAIFHQFLREGKCVQDLSEAVMALSVEQGFTSLLAGGTLMRGRALAAQGQPGEGLEQMQQGITLWRSLGSELAVSRQLALLAEVNAIGERIAEGLLLLDEALTLVEKNAERWWEAEIHRLQGELLLQQSSDNATKAESCFQQAIAIACHQQAKSWELRAATSLSRLWKQQGKRDEAYNLLAPVYNWFTEGFDTADLIDAKALLDEIQESSVSLTHGSP